LRVSEVNISIKLKGCHEHNLTGFSVEIPKGKFTAVTGVSGSGKSSLAFDTLFAEGQRRFMEGLCVRYRRSLRQLPKPAVEAIDGLSPTLAVEQSAATLSRRSTVGTQTDIYDLLALLYSRLGTQHSPTTDQPLHRQTQQEIVETILRDHPEGTRLQLLAPIERYDENLEKMGYIRLRIDGRDIDLSEEKPKGKFKEIEVVVDRLVVKPGVRERLADSLKLALRLGRGVCKVDERFFSEVYVSPDTGERFDPLSPSDFNFNSIHGACLACQGVGCEDCHHTRLKRQSRHVRLSGLTLPELCALPISDIDLSLTGPIADELLPRLRSRLDCLLEIGLGYLSLNRRGDTLSVGEAQRVQLAAQIGADLSGVIYVLDEPSRGLHRQETTRLGQSLLRLRDLGNTLVVVEHDPHLIALADHILELGPGAGIHGGNLLYSGPLSGWKNRPQPLPFPKPHAKPTEFIEVRRATLHNIQDLHLDIPLHRLVGLCGPSGSGKSTLLIDHLAPTLKATIVDQRAAGLSPISIPATYIGLMPLLRTLFSETPLARARGYTPAHFSLTKRGARCEACQGLGRIKVKMDFLPDVYTPCEVCDGTRYNFEALQVLWNGHSIADILALTSEQALRLLTHIPDLARRLQLLTDLGLDYLQLGQSFTTLSGGERQRLKLVTALARKQQIPTIYILDEPSAGLHATDIAKLATILHRLVENGHSVLLIEHNLDLLRQCDHLIEMGPEGGPRGGKVLFTGSPKQLAGRNTPTGQAFSGDRRKSRL
jgi:excinuclease ABC subunit A